ncbi:Mus7/MMS22 family-domain-containing protein [Hypoxylon sp. NC0597]|nr:Mus7/MMS22 family-domain-containing protein [Hypoxylon sp. NC0597]
MAAKWKELGEVPDSDDESGFDSSQESEHELPLQVTDGVTDGNPEGRPDSDSEDELAASGPARQSRSIWDIPLSSQDSAKERNIIGDSIRPPGELPPPTTPTAPETTHDLDSSPLSSPVLELSDGVENSARACEINTLELDESRVPEVPPAVSTNRFTDAVFEVRDNLDEGEGSLTTDTVRPGRSLRPRKPIQEHPYLLESVQYSKTLRSHGVRPLRVQLDEAARKRQEEDSQEQEYEEESQSTARELAPEDSGESQGIQPPGLLDNTDDEEVRLAKSSPPLPEHAEIRPEDLLRSSQDDEEEFPDPADVDKWKLDKRRPATTKRQGSPKVSKKRKLPKLHQPVRFERETSPLAGPGNIFDIPPSPPQTSPNFQTTTPVAALGRARPVTTLTPKLSSTISSQNQSPAPANQSARLIDLTMVEDEDDTGNEQDTGSSSDSEGDPETLRAAMRRRMRGVLPASWLRLDQQGTRQKGTRALPQRSPDRSPERTQRKGIAQRRQISPKPSNDPALFLDDSDDDDMTLRINDFDNEPNSYNSTGIPIFEDDAGSVVEDDHIDYMLSGNKRANLDPDGSERPRKRKKNQQSMFKGQPGQPKRQQRITGLLNRTKSSTAQSTAKRHRARSGAGGGRQAKEVRRTPARPTLPPELSILDVVEPNAPPFIRVAARTAKRRQDKGRSSPSRKQIALGTRKDNIDAIGVLRDWKKGRILPRTTPSMPSKTQTELPGPLHPLSNNSVIQPPKKISKPRSRPVMHSSHFSQPRRMVKQASLDNFVSVESEVSSTQALPRSMNSLPKRSQLARAKSYNTTSRPAQLETVGSEQLGRHAFDARKRALDALYRKSRRALPMAASIGLERLVGESVSVEILNGHVDGLSSRDSPDKLEPVPVRKRLKYRKRFQPQQVDTTAPQYAHANDPLPREASPVDLVVETAHISESAGKLLGLGPFGTHYTQHFEIFPLDLGVFFHESTVLGSGRVIKALAEKSPDSLRRLRGRVTFTLGEKVLQWGQWDAQTSSEFGIVFDWVADYLHSDSPDSTGGANPVQAADFVLDYLQGHINLSDQESEKHFAGRALEILQSFAERLETISAQSRDRVRVFTDVLSRSLIISFQILRICHSINQLSETFQLEDVLTKIAKTTARQLFKTGLVDIRNLYHDLQRLSFRERGIRNEQYSLACWVILIRILEESRIPRSGFWDVVSSIMLNADPNSISDAHTFERIWYDLFTLLPLGEFDNTGVVIPGRRHTMPLEGWALPQKLLRRVFQLYQSNSRQAPSFNDYCRGVISRCHYLIEQWGWRKSNGILGTIFDFFAARGLSHLRNEEVYKSPEFLEHLTGSPSLAIMPEDKCFHIFLKLLALSVKSLQNQGFTKDVRNMVARVLPNHDRQFDKEKDIHESDLAALRNHHDLLCTLFWAAPASLRPSVQTIEKLVSPASSHKEACLISLRAWSQLSRFVMSLNEDTGTYKPFADWQKSLFQQVMEQYLSAESDIQQQLARMSKDASKNISREMMNAVIKLNRKGAMDVLHFSMKGFLDVIRHAQTLSAVSFALNHYQLDQVFTRFPFSSADFDWSSLRVALDVLDYYITRIEKFFAEGPATTDHSWHGEDAIMLLERKLAVPFFSMARTVAGMDFRDTGLGPTSDRSICMEQAVLLAGRLAARLIHARLSRVSQFFVAGRYSIFQNTPKGINSPLRRYHALFLATLIEQGVDDFKDIGGSILDLFLMELVKPLNFLAYENKLALVMKRHGNPYLRDAVIEIGNNPDYGSNKDLFARVVSAMRRTLRIADTSQRQQLQSQFSKALRSTMEQMKLDLKSITLDSPEHAKYIEFVRSIVTVIRSQDLCPVDSYFYQISREYSPSRQDPRLQIAGILSWGLKLEEGDTKAVSGLFYLLFPNFKLALANGQLADEKVILQQGMGNPHVFSFMLSSMFPAIIKTALQVPEGWVILDTYVDALEALLTTPCIHRTIGKEDTNGLLAILESSMTGIRLLRTYNTADLHSEHVYTLIQIIRLLNLLSPSIKAYLINSPTMQVAMDITEAVDAFTDFAREAGKYLSTLLSKSERRTASNAGQIITVDPDRLFRGLGMDLLLEPNEHVSRFVNHMVRDIQDNWVSDGSTISVRGPSRVQGNSATQTGQGTVVPRWNTRKLIQILNRQLQEWNYANDRAATTTSSTASLLLTGCLF